MDWKHRFAGGVCLIACAISIAGCNRRRTMKLPIGLPPVPVDIVAVRSKFTPVFQTPKKPLDNNRPPAPTSADVFSVVHYPAGPGPMWAYLTPPPTVKSQRQPAVVWCHYTSGDMGIYNAHRQASTNDQTPRAFVEAGMVVMVPTYRGVNGNPGHFEMFYGEVDDVLAAVEYVSKLPYVDPNRVYVAGAAIGGTMTLLAAEAAPTGKVRAAFSIGGMPAPHGIVMGSGADVAPFDINNAMEVKVRSPSNFITGLKTPTWYFEGSTWTNVPWANRMATDAAAVNAPFHLFIVDKGTHTDVTRPMTRLIANQILQDTGPTCRISVNDSDVQAAYAAEVAVRPSANAVVRVRITPAAAAAMDRLEARKMTPQSGPLEARLEIDLTGRALIGFVPKMLPGELEVDAGGRKIIVDPGVAAEIGPVLIGLDLTKNQWTLTPDKSD